MLKTFKYQNVQVTVKTTMLKNGIAYFGEKDVAAELESAMKALRYDAGKVTPEEFTVLVWKKLTAANIAPSSIVNGDIEYTGVKMTDLASNKQIA